MQHEVIRLHSHYLTSLEFIIIKTVLDLLSAIILTNVTVLRQLQVATHVIEERKNKLPYFIFKGKVIYACLKKKRKFTYTYRTTKDVHVR